MSTTLLGVALFVFLLFPGYAYERRRVRHVPEWARSPFGETLSIVFVGVVLDAVPVFLLALASPRLPRGAPDLELLAGNPRGYASDDYEPRAWWAAVVLLLATGMGYLADHRRHGRPATGVRPGGLQPHRRADNRVPQLSIAVRREPARGGDQSFTVTVYALTKGRGCE